MAQHFLLSAKARTLSLKTVFRMGEDAAYGLFCEMRWPDTEGEPVCPRCGCVEAYHISTRRKFKCVACHHQFSVTSGTIFASRKLSFTDLLAAIAIFVNGAKGISALQASRDLDVQYKTAFVLFHKLREAMALEVAGAKLNGIVEIDGGYFGGHVKPANRKEDRNRGEQVSERQLARGEDRPAGDAELVVTCNALELAAGRDVIGLDTAATRAHRLAFGIRPAHFAEQAVGGILAHTENRLEGEGASLCREEKVLCHCHCFQCLCTVYDDMMHSCQ